jgi:hypothetical protein
VIAVLGDVHADFGRLNWWLNKHRPEIVLQCGDWGYWPKFNLVKAAKIPAGTRVWFCDGNHEDHESLLALNSTEIQPGLHYVPRGGVLTLPDGRNVLFMGGARSIDAHLRTPGLDWFPQEILTPWILDTLDDQHIDIVISHTCPLEFGIAANIPGAPGVYGDTSRAVLSEVLKRFKPDLWYFGHWHKYKTGVYDNCRWTALDHIRGIQKFWTPLD